MNIKEKIQRTGIPYWVICSKIGIAESTMIRWLRQPEKLPKEKIKMIDDALIDLMKEAK